MRESHGVPWPRHGCVTREVPVVRARGGDTTAAFYDVFDVWLRRCSPVRGVGLNLQLGFLVLVAVDVIIAPGSSFSSAYVVVLTSRQSSSVMAVFRWREMGIRKVVSDSIAYCSTFCLFVVNIVLP